jgi:hypothetical protein
LGRPGDEEREQREHEGRGVFSLESLLRTAVQLVVEVLDGKVAMGGVPVDLTHTAHPPARKCRPSASRGPIRAPTFEIWSGLLRLPFRRAKPPEPPPTELTFVAEVPESALPRAFVEAHGRALRLELAATSGRRKSAGTARSASGSAPARLTAAAGRLRAMPNRRRRLSRRIVGSSMQRAELLQKLDIGNSVAEFDRVMGSG